MKTLGKKPNKKIKDSSLLKKKEGTKLHIYLMTLVSLTFDRFVGMKQTHLKINTGIHVHARS